MQRFVAANDFYLIFVSAHQFEQFAVATGMVVVVVRGQNGGQFETFLLDSFDQLCTDTERVLRWSVT